MWALGFQEETTEVQTELNNSPQIGRSIPQGLKPVPFIELGFLQSEQAGAKAHFLTRWVFRGLKAPAPSE